ncbi:arginine vasopressin-induced protein 1 [Tachyglossus aculeatus]|uniref:arginine vasopressin-induced protein 1 n=1 Tax=Tachyglossus aculeatus TaxID=9261 RepID=UPI0018F43CEF|nr:arginine vasopressin-induced protein 1 [Tachyglossus aculeatus]
MGTPASVVSEPPPEPRGRKQASANIFQDAELLRIQSLFQRVGDRRAEERARIVWECAGEPGVAQALRRLSGKRRRRPPQDRADHRARRQRRRCGRPRMPKDHPSATASPTAGATETAAGPEPPAPRRTSARIRQHWGRASPRSYLHQIRH